MTNRCWGQSCRIAYNHDSSSNHKQVMGLLHNIKDHACSECNDAMHSIVAIGYFITILYTCMEMGNPHAHVDMEFMTLWPVKYYSRAPGVVYNLTSIKNN